MIAPFIDMHCAALIACLFTLTACAASYVGPQPSASPPPCPLTNINETFASFDALPAPIKADLLDRFPESVLHPGHNGMAPRDGIYSANSLIETSGPNRRFIQAARIGNKTIVLYEHGNDLRHSHAVVYESDAKTGSRTIVNVMARPHELCQTTETVLNDPDDESLWRNRFDW